MAIEPAASQRGSPVATARPMKTSASASPPSAARSSPSTTSSSLWRELRNQLHSDCPAPRSLLTSRRQPHSDTLSAAMPKTRMPIAT